MIEMALNNIQKYYGANLVLKDITFDIQNGERAGIVGENGCGKSTLLRIMMGIEGYDGGILSVRKGASLGYLEQMPAYAEGFKVIDILNTAFEKADNVYEEMRMLEMELSQHNNGNIEKILARYSEAQVLYESLGGYEKDEKLSRVCTGLKIDQDFLSKPFAALSGGEKTTVMLGRILLKNPDILLLDEPSNHLDLEAMEFLEGYLKEYKGTVLIVSHDRYFLDNAVQKIIEIEDKVSKTYIGNYSEFVKEKDRQLLLQMETFLDQQKKIKSMEKTISQLRDWGNRGDNSKFFRRAASMQIRLDKLERVDKPVLDRNTIRIGMNSTGRSGNDVVIIENLSKSYRNKVLLENSNLLIRNGERVGIIGANGCGKTTLIKILLGEIKCDSGEARLGSSIKLAYLPQNISFSDENMTVLDCFREGISITEGRAREYLAKYMFFGESVFKKTGSLSGGERTRLMLLKLMYNEVNLLILDEPTNHLDIASREELEAYLGRFEGTLLFISHDRYFINNTANRVVEHINGALVSYAGNYEYYKEKKIVNRIEPQADESAKAVKVYSGRDKSITPGKAVVQRNSADIEFMIGELEEKLRLIDHQIEKYESDYEKLNGLYIQKMDLNKRIEDLMGEYYNEPSLKLKTP